MGNFYRVSRSPLAKIPVIKFFEKILGNAGIGWEFWLQTFLSWRANGLLSFAVEQIEVSHRTGGRESVVRTSFVLTSPNGAFQISRFPKNSKNSMQGKISHPPPQGRFELLGRGHHIRQLYNEYDHMFKNTASTSTSKKCILKAHDFKHINISKRKNSNFLKPESGSEKA